MFIIYGTKGVTSVVETGDFACPGCGGLQRPYSRVAVNRYFTLFFIPLIPLGKAGEYIECRNCGGQFDERALVELQEVVVEKIRVEFIEHVKRLMVLTAIADGPANATEIDAIRATCQELSGEPLSKADVDRELYLARLSKGGLADYPRRFKGQLDDEDKQAVMRSIVAIAGADGPIGDDERKLLEELAADMGMEPSVVPQIQSTG
jgi:tellurite resistance protein